MELLDNDRLIQTLPDNKVTLSDRDSSPDIDLSEERDDGQSKNNVRVSQINTTYTR